MGDPPQACICLKQKSGRLYIGKLAVDQNLRGHGFARQLITLAEERARVLGCAELELETRIELTENHHVFRQLGFVKTSDGAHDGFDRPTYIVLRKSVTD